jgi:putative endopeptidase
MEPSSSLRRLRLAGAAPCLALLLACAHAKEPAASPSPAPSAGETAAGSIAGEGLHFDIGAVDPHIDPCTDFYDFACGGWRRTHPIPPDQTRWDRYSELEAVDLEHERSIVEDAARASAGASPVERRIGVYYASCMDEHAIDARGLAPVRDVLARIDAARTTKDAADVVTDLHAHGIDALFDSYAEPDPHNARQTIAFLDIGSLGLPSPDDYTKTDPTAVTLRARYVEYLGRLFHLLGATDADAKVSAARLLAFETSLANNALSVVEARHLDAQDHPMTLGELGVRYAAIDWKNYFAAIGAPAADRVNVAQPAWLDAVNTALSSSDLGGARDYLRMIVVRAFATILPHAIDDEVFGFNERTVRGVHEAPARWKRCLGLIDRDIGDDVGAIFVKRYFKEDARAKMKAMIDALLASFRADLRSRTWLGADARAAAETKLSSVLVVIGASNRPRALDGLRVESGDPFGNAWRARALKVAEEMADVGKPTDREKFFNALPQEADGFGSKPMNATGFTAGFLQPPVFDPRIDDAVNFGGLGSVIGHELSHRFDDEGRKFDSDGNLRSWWSPQDVARFEERAQCFIDEYSRFRTDDGTPLDGKLTLGENIADNGGIRLSYAALRPSETGPKIDGFTPAQRFFLAWGQIRCENVTPEAARRQAQTNPHAAGRWRVNGVVPNVPEFATAFACAAASPMTPAKRCEVW